MYETFYGFTDKPFQLNPDPEFYFDSRQHRRAMAFVEYGLHQSEGFIVITGEVGAGKTTLVRNMLANLDPAKVVAANLVSTQLDAEDTLRMVSAAFGIPTRGVDKSELLMSLEALLASHAEQGRRCLLIVDEAQNLTPRAVEELRMLSNFQLGTHALLQSFLVGQPEFRFILQSPQMNQLRQRVIAACHIGPLDLEDTQHYIEHRLARVGWKGDPAIPPAAFKAVHDACGGVPRRINLLCDRVLLSGFLAERRSFSVEAVREVADEIGSETQIPKGFKHPLPEFDAEALQAPAAPRAGQNGSRGDLTAAGDYRVIPSQSSETIEGQLSNVERSIKELEASMERIERGNQATLHLFRRFLDWVRSNEVGRNDRT
jgi:general secretion pathway protein A